jgi:cysteine desulfurase
MVTKEPVEKRHYFDWAASAPYSETGSSNVSLYGNPSSLHNEGRKAKEALEDARKRAASILNVPAETLFFTGGGTESNSIVLFSTLMRKSKGRVIASMTEHSSVREGIETLDKMGKSTGIIEVDSTGRVTPSTLGKVLEKYNDIRFAGIMSVNNETGAVTDIDSVGKIIRNVSGAPVHFHCDLVQAAGKIPVDIEGWGLDSASVSAHKIGGPRGIGLLYLRRPVEVFYKGGGQESGIRGGTENVYGAVALADCLERLASPDAVTQNYQRAKARWKKLISALLAAGRAVIIPKEASAQDAVAQEGFSPYILQVAFKDIPGEVMARALDDLGFAVSTGSACSSFSPERPVLAAMGVSENLRIEGIRISQGWSTTDEDIEKLIGGITEVLKFL